MARYIVFNGITQVHPGALSRVNVDALAQVGSSINGIIGLLGEADQGAPDTLYTFDDMTTAKTIYGAGPLADGIRICFEPANDPRVPTGAFRVKTYKVNQSTRSTFILRDASANAVGTLTSVNYGAETSQISFEIENDPIDSDRRMITQYDPDGTTEQITDIGDRPLMDVVYKGPDEPVIDATIAGPGVSGGNTTILWASAAATDVGKHVICTASAGGTLPAVGEIRRISAATPGVDITVDQAFTDILNVAATDTGDAGGNMSYNVISKMLASIPATTVAATSVVLQEDPTGGVTPTIAVLAANVTDYQLWIRVMSGPGAGQIRAITGAAGNAAGQMTLTVASFDTNNLPTTASTFGIIMVDSVVGAIAGANGAAATLTSVNTAAASFAPGEVAAANLNQTLTGNTVSDVIAAISAIQVAPSQPSAGSVWEATAGVGRSAALSATRFDFDVTNQAVALTYDVGVAQNLTTNKFHRFLDNLQLLIDTYNDQSEIVSCARSTGAAEGAGLPINYTTPTYLGTGIGGTTGARGTSSTTNWQTGFDEFLKTRVNIIVPLISQNLYAGAVPIDTINAQLSAHVDTAAGIGKTERNGYASIHKTGTSSLTDVLAAASVLNNYNVSLACQMPTVLDVDGNLVQQEEWAMGCLYAGIQAGTPIGEPPTFKYIRASAVDQDSDLDPTDRTISNSLQLGGVMIVEPGPTAGFRIVRALTTYLTDDNIARTDVNVREVINYISYELRTQVENKFTGLKATPARAADVKGFVNAWLAQARTDEIIVDSTDPDTGAALNAWLNLRVTFDGDIVRIYFQVYPVLGINYETIDAYAQLPVISV